MNYPRNRRSTPCAADCTCGRHSHREYSGGRRSPEYSAWVNARYRCNNPAAPAYADYGGRGISVDSRWDSFEAFLADMGRRPGPEYSLDRIDNDGDYAPGNVRWATRTEQLSNRRKFGFKLTPQDVDLIRSMVTARTGELAERFSVSRNTIRRIRNREIWV
jgi:hypothetical protein